jgi:hypothetical protein
MPSFDLGPLLIWTDPSDGPDRVQATGGGETAGRGGARRHAPARLTGELKVEFPGAV